MTTTLRFQAGAYIQGKGLRSPLATTNFTADVTSVSFFGDYFSNIAVDVAVMVPFPKNGSSAPAVLIAFTCPDFVIAEDLANLSHPRFEALFETRFNATFQLSLSATLTFALPGAKNASHPAFVVYGTWMMGKQAQIGVHQSVPWKQPFGLSWLELEDMHVRVQKWYRAKVMTRLLTCPHFV